MNDKDSLPLKPSVLVLSFVEWGGAYQRPHHLAEGLAGRGWRVTYASPGYVHRRGKAVASGRALPETLQIVEATALPGGSRLAGIAALNGAAMRRALGKYAPEGGWDAIIFNEPRFARIAAALPARGRIFDCMDDLSAQAPSEALAAKWVGEALQIADAIWTGTPSLADRLAAMPRRAAAAPRFIACGVDWEHFARPKPEDVERARREMALPSPLAGYFGVINERLDASLIEGLLASGPWNIALIGPSTSRAPRLPQSDRLRVIGPQAYAALPAYLACFDLAIIPYDVQGSHRYLYPVKALEYLAGEKPVLSSPLPDLQKILGSYLEFAEGREGWRAAGGRLVVDREAATQRARIGAREAARRGWDAMIDEMLMDLLPAGSADQ